MASDLEVINEALTRLGASPIASLDDAGAQATVARLQFRTIADRYLAESLWYWALKRVQLPRISLAAGEFDEFEGDFKHVYQLPADLIRSVGLSSCQPFRIMRDRLFTDDETPVLLYVFRAEVSRWPGYFRDMVVSYLAAAMAISITDSANRASLWLTEAERARPRAMAIDAQQTPPEVFNLMRVYLRRDGNPLAVA